MSFHWPAFLLALALLLPPAGLFCGEKIHYRAISRDWHRHWRQILSLRLHAVDLARGALGGGLLTYALAGEAKTDFALFLAAVVLGGAIVLQTLWCKAPRATLAPFAFVTGLALGCCPPAVSIFALALAAVLGAGLRKPGWFFPLLAVSLLGAGTLFLGRSNLPGLAPIAAAVALPWLLALLTSRHFVISYLARSALHPAASARTSGLR